MTKKTPPETRPQTLEIEQRPDEPSDAAIARNVLRPSVQAGITLLTWNPTKAPVELPALVRALREQSNVASAGDLSRGEALLMSQAHTLDTIFNSLAQTARLNLFKNIDHADILLRLALKAQAQCRANIEALAEIKNPSHATFVRQANIANGPQQVNNGPMPLGSRAGETLIQPNELLEQTNGERMDRGTQSTAAGADPPVEAVGVFNGAKVAGR